MAADQAYCLALRLAGPLQSWGSRSQFNRRETDNQPTKSGVIGLLAAADGRRREDPIMDLVDLRLGVRVDQQGTLLRDYHTVSDYRGQPLLSASVNAKGFQKSTPYTTYPTERFYLQDAVFVAVLEGSPTLLEGLASAIAQPGFPLALGRRSCVPTQPILVKSEADGAVLWRGDAEHVIHSVPWQAAKYRRARLKRQVGETRTIDLAATVDDPDGPDVCNDVPVSFVHRERQFITRHVRHLWARVPTGFGKAADEKDGSAGEVHDPFALLGW